MTRRAEVGLLAPQAEVVRSTATNAGYFAGYGAGKTFLLAFLALLYSQRYPGIAGGLGSPTLKSARRDVIPELKKLMRRIGVRWEENKQEYWIRPSWMTGEGRIYYAGCNDPDSLKGPNWGWLLLNEPGIVSRESYDVLQSRLRVPLVVCDDCDTWREDGEDLLGRRRRTARATYRVKVACRCGSKTVRVDPNWIRLGGTPEGFNWLYDEWIDEDAHPERDWSDWLRVHADTSVNIFNPTSYRANLEGSFDPLLAKEKLEGRFINVRSGQVYYQFDREVHLADCAYDPSLPLLLSWDFNVEPLCTVVAQQHGESLWVIDQVIAETNARTAEVMQEFCARYAGHRGEVVVFGDATGKRRDTRSRFEGDYHVIREVAKAAKLNMRLDVPKGNPERRHRWNLVNGMLRNVHGQVRLWIDHQRCPSLVRDLEKLGFKKGTMEPDPGPDGLLGHSADALGYLITRRFRIKGRGGVVKLAA